MFVVLEEDMHRVSLVQCWRKKNSCAFTICMHRPFLVFVVVLVGLWWICNTFAMLEKGMHSSVGGKGHYVFISFPSLGMTIGIDKDFSSPSSDFEGLKGGKGYCVFISFTCTLIHLRSKFDPEEEEDVCVWISILSFCLNHK